MATIIQKPDTLSLSRNLKELIISTSSEISLQLLKGDSLLLEETYLPDVNNRVHVDLADIVTSTLSLTMPSGDAVSTSQSSVYSDFTVKVDGTSVAEFTAVRSGVERFSDTAANFLTANWLTWQPQVKEVLHDQPEWLTYYPASGSCACYARFYYTDGTSGEKKVCDVSQCVSINTRFSKLWALDESGKERYGVIDVYIKDAQGLRLTYVQRYVLCSQGALDEVYLCENSLGGLDTFRFSGDRKLVPEIGYTSLLLDNSYTAADPDLSRKWSQNTGMLTGRECEWCWELFRSSAAYHLYRGTILPIVLDASSVEKSAMSVLAAYSFDYRYASDLGLLNVVRSENLPEVVEVSGPDAEVFFLTPRLNEFPSAVLSDDLIIPVQSPYEESWYTLSVGGLKSALLSSVETIYGPMWHVHDNLQVLNLLSVDEKGNLLYNGLAVGSGIVGAHDHHGETIRPEKIIVGDVEITCVDGRLHISKGLVSDGDLAAFGAEEGEEGGSGGLDIARLWEELEAKDSTKVIDESHMPGSVVLQDELTEILDDYPLTTEMNTALAGKADKDWVEEELAKYLLLTGGKISGDLEVAGTLKIGDAVLSYADGRLHVSSSVTSDGDFVAFGDEEGSTGSGGLDVDRMWDELEAEGTEQIHASHLSDALTGYATQTYVDGRINDLINGAPAAYDTLREIADVLEGNVDSIGDILTALGGKADKADTLAGYGIKDAYTKTQIDEELAKYVTIAGNQDITGVKTFVNGIKIGSISLSVVDGRLHVSSTVTSDGDFVAFGDEDGASGSGGLDIARLWQELEADDSSKVIDASHIPSITKAKISDFPTKWAWADISGKPSTFAPSAHSHAISDVTGLQGALDSKWVWNESQVKAVKVNSAASADNADTLDGVHANGLLTALTSSATTNLSLTVGGKSLSVAGLYAKFADQLRTARKINGTSFSGAYDITTEKWGMARLVSIKDYTQDNTGATKSVDGQESFSLLLPQSIKVKTLDVDGVTLSVVDGRLHISATATSAGDFVAYGDDEGGTGVLDVDKLWKELGGSGGSVSSKVIDLSHIPSIPTSKITGLSDYVWNILVTPGTLTGPKISASHLPPLSDLSGNLDSSRITGLDNALSGYVSSVTTSGAGNAVTGYAKSGNTLTLKKDLTFLTSVPKATSSAYGGIKVGYPESGKNYPVELDSSGRAYVSVPWVNTTYSLSSFGITATAEEINKLDGVGTLLHSGNYTSYTVTKTGRGASGTWGINISGNAATADVSNYLFLNPNNGTHASQNDAVPANGRFAIYDVNTATTAGGSDGYIMAFRWPSGSWATQVFLDADDTGIMALRHRSSSNVWTDWYRILHSGNIGSYALTKSNYTSYLDSRYVNASGDTMTGTLNISSSSEALVIYQISGSNKAASGYLASQGAYLYSWPAGKYLHITDSGLLLFGSSTVWHSGYDGSGSGLDADLLDGKHNGSVSAADAQWLKELAQIGTDYTTVKAGKDRLAELISSQGVGIGYPIRIGESFISQWDDEDASTYASSDYEVIKIGGGYSGSTYGQWLLSSYNLTHIGVVGRSNNAWSTIKWLAFTTDNVASATKLQTAHTLWGQSFNGTTNVSGEISSCSRIKNASNNRLFLGNSDNSGWVYTQDIASQNGTPYWVIAQTGNAWFKKINVGYTYSTQGSYALNVNGTAGATSLKSLSINIECDDTGALGVYAGEINRAGSLYIQHRGGSLYLCGNGGNVGIGTTSPAYKLDVAGEIRATSGITIGSTDDYGWYISTGTRISAGVGVARGVNVGSLLVSSVWADYTKVPTNGIYSKGDIITGGRLFIPSSEGNDKYYIRIE